MTDQLGLFEAKPVSPDTYVSDEDSSSTGMFQQKTSHVMRVDGYDEYRGKQLIDSNVLSQARRNNKRYGKDYELDCDMAADSVAALSHYRPEMVHRDLCNNEGFHDYMSNVMQSDDFKKLHRRTMCNGAVAEIAAAQLIMEYYQLQQQQQEKQKNGNQQSDDQKNQDQQNAANKAVNNAIKDADDAEDMMSNLGIGNEPGSDNHIDPSLLTELFHSYKTNRNLNEILQLVGQYMVVAKNMQKEVSSEEPEEVTDVTISGSIKNLLPSEMCMLCLPETEDRIIQKVIERRALSYQLGAESGKQAGPVILFCDESGSMMGTPNQHAKAIALVMAWIAVHQNRFCQLNGFSDRTSLNTVTLNPKDPPAERSKKILQWVNTFQSGGTSFEFLHPDKMEKIFQDSGAPRGETDVLLITDGYGYYDEGKNAAIKAWKEENNCRFIAIGVGVPDKPIPKIADQSYVCERLGTSEEAVKAAFSISPHQPSTRPT